MDFGAYLERAARLFPRHRAVVCEGETITYAELHEQAAALAAGLTDLGLKPGDRVVELRDNTLDAVIFEYGIAMAGLVRVPLTPRLMPAEIPHLVAATGARALCTNPQHAELARAVDVEFTIADGMEGALSRADISTVPSGDRYRAGPDDLFALRHTGGTTGLPKAAMQTHSAMVAMAIHVLMEFVEFTEDDLMLTTQPYTHGGGLYTLPAAIRGAAIMMQPKFDVGVVLDAIETHRVTTMKIVPTVLFRLLQEQRERPRDLSSLRLLAYGAAPMPEELLRDAMGVFDCHFTQTYGGAEAPGTIACLTWRDHQRERTSPGTTLRSVGRPYPMVDVAILDGAGAEVAEREVGEVSVRGNIITAGFWNRPDLNEDLLNSDGRVRTGDMGYLEDGYLYLVGRKNDVIITGGFNVYPPEVEGAITAIAGVRDAAVTSVPDLEWGDRVIAAVVLEDGHILTADDVKEGCRARIAGYKTPKEILFLPELPLTANTKVDRKAIRRLYTDNRNSKE